jgi:uncharacterized protein (DUF1697 family)
VFQVNNRNCMIHYVAFLRGINVGGHKKILMKDLEQWFLSMKFTGVRTYIQSGNVAFGSEITVPGELKFTIEKQLKDILACEVEVILRSREQLIQMAAQNPFDSFQGEPADKHYVCFMGVNPTDPYIKLPHINEKEGLHLISVQNGNAYVVSRQINGRYGFPNNWIEKLFRVSSTARNWNTIQRIVESQEQNMP